MSGPRAEGKARRSIHVMLGLSIFLRVLRRTTDLTCDLITVFVLWGTVLFGYVCLSLVLYAVLRKLVVPEKFHARPVHFQYEYVHVYASFSVCVIHTLLCRPCVPQQIQNGSCPFPKAEFVLGSDQRVCVKLCV